MAREPLTKWDDGEDIKPIRGPLPPIIVEDPPIYLGPPVEPVYDPPIYLGPPVLPPPVQPVYDPPTFYVPPNYDPTPITRIEDGDVKPERDPIEPWFYCPAGTTWDDAVGACVDTTTPNICLPNQYFNGVECVPVRMPPEDPVYPPIITPPTTGGGSGTGVVNPAANCPDGWGYDPLSGDCIAPVQTVGNPPASTGGGGTPPGTIEPPANAPGGGIVGADGKIFGFEPSQVAIAAAVVVGLFLFSGSKK